ncbi:MAG: hypothetical protein Q8Q35_01280 [Nanoarchaeota archaeon]|nr:hypothetical protein [Nanoarchaeota archaeon]
MYDFLVRNSVRSDIEYSQFKGIIDEGKSVTFYNWECPIRSYLRPGNSELEFVCEFVDSEEAIQKTRAISSIDLEKTFVDEVVRPLRETGMRVNYFKFLADTNSELLYPETVNLEVKKKMFSFGRRLQTRMDEVVGSGVVTIMSFSQVLDMYRKEYMEVFNQVKYSFFMKCNDIPETRFMTMKKFRNELVQLKDHAGVEGCDDRLLELGKRVVASYAAEEFVLRTKVANEDWFKNPVAVPNESMFTFPVMANAYLGNKQRGPWLFVMYEGGKNGQL